MQKMQKYIIHQTVYTGVGTPDAKVEGVPIYIAENYPEALGFAIIDAMHNSRTDREQVIFPDDLSYDNTGMPVGYYLLITDDDELINQIDHRIAELAGDLPF